MNADGLSVIVPLSQTENAKSINSWFATLNSLQRPYEIILVLEGIQEGLVTVGEAIASRNNRVKLVHQTAPTGFGSCIKAALSVAVQPLIFYASSEPGWQPADLVKMLKSIEQTDQYSGLQVQIVNGRRKGIPLPPGRASLRRASRIFTRIVLGYWPETQTHWLGREETRFWWRCRLQFGLRLSDINCPFKLIRRAVFDRMELQSDGEFIHAEILAKANFLGCMMDEVLLADRQVIQPLPEMRAERKRVFRNPKFRSPFQAKPPVAEVMASEPLLPSEPAVSSEPLV